MEQNSKISTAFMTQIMYPLLFLLCIVFGVNGNIQCWPEDPTSGEETRKFCSALNSTLLYMTVGIQKTLLDHFQTSDLSRDKDEVSSWTNHHVNRQFFDEGKIYFSEFPFSDDVPFYEDSVFCIYTTFYLNNKTVGWVPSDCSDNYLNSIDCCYYGQHNIEAFNATLYTEAVTWYTAENYCSNEGSYLVNLTQLIGFHSTFVTTPWLSPGVTKFWTGHYSTGKNLKDLEIAEIHGFGEVENNQTGCVYVSVESRYHNFPKLQLATDSCNNAMYGFICLKPTKYRYFDRTPNLIYISNYIKYDGQPYTFTECEDECLQLSKKGYACIGFNYNKANSSCRFKETIFNGKYNVQYDPDWVSVDYTYVHALVGDYTPQQITVSTSSGGSSSKEVRKSTNNEGITALSYLYDRNDQATLPLEKKNIRDSDNTSDHPAATKDINIDTTVLGKTFTIGACIVVAGAGVVVLGSIFVKIMKITQKGKNSNAINSSHYCEDYFRLSSCAHVVSGLTSQNNFINRPPGNFQLRRQRNNHTTFSINENIMNSIK